MGKLTEELVAREKMKEYQRQAQEIWQYRRKGKEPAQEPERRSGRLWRKGNEGRDDRGVVCSTL